MKPTRRYLFPSVCGAAVAGVGAVILLPLAGMGLSVGCLAGACCLGALAGLAGARATYHPRLSTDAWDRDTDLVEDKDDRIHTIVASIPCAVYRCSLDRHWTMHVMGKQIEEITGYPASDFLHNTVRSYASIVHPDDAGPVGEEVYAAVDANRPWALEYRIAHANGLYRYVFERGRAVRDERGKVRHLDGFILDNTARHRAEEALLAEKGFIESALNSLPGLFYMYDAQATLVRWNRNLEVISGYSHDEVAGMLAADFFAPEDRAVTEEAMKAVFETGKSWMENDLLTKDGRRIPHYFTGIRASLADGEYLVGMAIDITDRKRAEEALRESEQQFRTLVEHAPEAIVILDCDTGKFAIANRNAEVLFGIPREEILKRSPTDLSPEFQPDGRRSEEAARVDVQRALDGGTPSFEWAHINSDGQEILCEVRLVRLPGERPLVRGSVTSIADRKNLENQLRQAQKMEAVGQLAGGVAHDFNNLLQVINGFTEMALEDLPEDAPARSSLEEVARAGKRAASVVGQLLAFSRRQVMRPMDLDLNDVVGKAINMVGRIIGEHIHLDFVPGHRLATIRADGGMLEQVLLNLCVNARDAMPNGGRLTITTENAVVKEEFCQTHPWARAGRFAVLHVTDTGAGIDAATMERIFEPFFSTKATGKGTGLGLSTVYGIIRQHDGVIGVESHVGLGSTFSVYLPITAGKAEKEPEAQEGPAPGGAEVILLAEDEALVRDFAARTLRRAGYTVLAACDGEEAVSLFRDHIHQIDLLLLDVVMPKLSGRRALELIRGLRNDVPALFASGYSEKALHTNFVLDDDVVLLQKPFTRDTLLRAVRRALDASG